MLKDRRKWELFWTFFKIGLFTFGGGYAMISVMMTEFGEKRKWIDVDELTDVFAIAESTPGPIAINSATYIGYKRAGIGGSIAATLGVVLPSFLIIYAISLCVDWFMQIKIVQNAFRGIQVAVGLLILRAGIRLIRKMPKKILPTICCAGAAVMIVLINYLPLNLSTIYLILAGAVIGIGSMLLQNRERKGGKG